MFKSLQELGEALKVIAPTKYSHFRDDPKTDYITYIDIGENGFFTDNTLTARNTAVSIELHTKEKNLALEEQVRDILKLNETPYDKNETLYDEDLDLFVTEFIIELND